MHRFWKGLSASTLLVAATLSAAAQDDTVKIGVLTDLSGFSADITGNGSIVAAQMAAEDFGGAVGDRKIEIISADTGNNTDKASQIARSWIDQEGVDAIADVPNSAVALAVNEVVRQKNKVLLVAGAGTPKLVTDACSPNTVLWPSDSYGLSASTPLEVLKEGGKSWFFITVDYTYGHVTQEIMTKVIEENGGQVLGGVLNPMNTPDFSAFLLQGQASGADVIGLINVGVDLQNGIKQAREFKITDTQKLVGGTIFITDIHTLGLEVTQGLYLSASFYWDMNEGTRAFAKRFAERHNGKMPTFLQAGVYASVLHYLKALKDMPATDDGAAVVKHMKQLPTDDPLFGQGTIRADGRKLQPMYVFQVKKPSESTSEWDLYRLVSAVPPEKAVVAMDANLCKMVAGQ